jgi:hypothetical protein
VTTYAIHTAAILALGSMQSATARVNPGFDEFTQRVESYLEQRRSAPRPRNTKNRAEINARQRQLAEAIGKIRAGAKPGDIFTPAAAEAFRRPIREVFTGPAAPRVRKTIRQGEPLPDWKLAVNAVYPERLPITTVPPTLLKRLPPLPSELAYRIVGHDFVLVDGEARLVLDFISGAVP